LHEAVTVHMKAPPDRIWELIADVTNTGRFSPETFEAKWIEPATGPALGARFRGHVNRNQRGIKYWTVCEVVECERGKVFAFDVITGGRALNRWKYELEPVGDGTDVTESFRLTPTPFLRLYWFFAKRGPFSRRKTNIDGMRTTLERIKAEVER
jgi:hypothetical protein